MELKVLSLTDVEQVRQWRNEQAEMLRTPFPLAKEQQEAFYRNVICNRQSNARYWGIWVDEKLVGMAGLENIQHENRLAEISLLLNPNHLIKLYEALRLILYEGFMNMNLENIYTEVYLCNPNVNIWVSAYVQFKEHECKLPPVLPNRKYWNGQYYDSLYLNITREDFWEHENIILKSAQTLN